MSLLPLVLGVLTACLRHTSALAHVTWARHEGQVVAGCRQVYIAAVTSPSTGLCANTCGMSVTCLAFSVAADCCQLCVPSKLDLAASGVFYTRTTTKLETVDGNTAMSGGLVPGQVLTVRASSLNCEGTGSSCPVLALLDMPEACPPASIVTQLRLAPQAGVYSTVIMNSCCPTQLKTIKTGCCVDVDWDSFSISLLVVNDTSMAIHLDKEFLGEVDWAGIHHMTFRDVGAIQHDDQILGIYR